MSKSSPDSMSPLNWDNIISKLSQSKVPITTRTRKKTKKCNNGEDVNECCNSSDKCQFIKDGKDNVENDARWYHGYYKNLEKKNKNWLFYRNSEYYNKDAYCNSYNQCQHRRKVIEDIMENRENYNQLLRRDFRDCDCYGKNHAGRLYYLRQLHGKFGNEIGSFRKNGLGKSKSKTKRGRVASIISGRRRASSNKLRTNKNRKRKKYAKHTKRTKRH